jgi:hypothetical protein
MRRAPVILLFALCLAQGAVKVGVFPAEVKRSFTVRQGLPDDRVRCVAVSGARVFAGTSKGLAIYAGESWKADARFAAHAVEACAAAGDTLYFTYDGAVQRLGTAAAERVGALPPGEVRSIAANGSDVYVATDRGLFRFETGRFVALNLAARDIRQVAVSRDGEVAVAAAEGLFAGKGELQRALPREGNRSWAVVDARGVAYDSRGRLWFASPQGAGLRESGAWHLFTGLEGLPEDDFTTVSAGEPGVVWFGTRRGAIRFDRKTWEYRQGLRWLPHDDVRAIAVTPGGDAWFATDKGAGVIERRPMTLAEKAKFFEDEIDRYHRRTEYGYVMAVTMRNPGDKSQTQQRDSDNDGLWTSMYGAGECFAYGATKDPLAKQRAKKAFEALKFLSVVTQGGEHPAPRGFPARAILPTSGPDPNVRDSRERDVRRQAEQDHLWKIMSPRWPKSADGKWYWKSDTSSDELDGHYFFYALYYDLVAETPQEKEEVRAVVRDITDHIIDHGFTLVDYDGKPARWGHFDPETLNSSRFSWGDRGLNSLSMLSYLAVAEHMTGDAKYRTATQTLVRKGHYDINLMIPKISNGLGSGNQSDDEMAMMNYYTLLRYEKDPELRQRYAFSLANYWDLERPEMNPFFNFVAASSLAGTTFTDAYRTYDLAPSGSWLDESIDVLKRLPLDRVDWVHENSKRRDIVHLRALNRNDDELEGTGYRRNFRVVPVDERFFEFWNHNPYRLDVGGTGRNLGDGAVFLLPYYMGLYHKHLEN